MSETIHAAVVAALADLTGVPKTRTAKIPTKDGGSYSYQFANIEDVVEHTRPVLAKHGLVALQPLASSEHGMAVSTVLVHESGETMQVGTLPFRPSGEPQRDGMAITYYRRYALLAALGMAAEDDDGTATRPENAAPAPQMIDDRSRQEIEALISTLDDDGKKLLRDEWKKRRIRKLEELTVDDVDAVHELIRDVELDLIVDEAGAPNQ